MALTYASNQYQIPRGRVFFDPYDTNDALTGERYLGNCPGFTVAVETEKAEHFSSESGLKQKDASILLQVTRTGTLTCDNMSTTNVGLFLSGAEATFSQSGANVSNEAISVIAGRYYQLGYGTSTPAGARNISSVVVEAAAATWVIGTAYSVGDLVKPTTPNSHYYRCTVAGTSHAATEPTWPTNGSTVTDGTATWDDAGTLVLAAGTDYNVDTDLGRLQILTPVGVVPTDIVVDYTRAAKTWTEVATGAESELFGALRIVADNASGDNRDFYMPYVSLQPSGEMPVIADGTDFASMQFTVDVLKHANMEAIYIDGRPA